MIDGLLAMIFRRPSERETRALRLHAEAHRKVARVSRSIRNGERPRSDSTPTTDELIDDVRAARNGGLTALGGHRGS